jgi:Polyketide cyclase / dehydrase and lipid transport
MKAGVLALVGLVAGMGGGKTLAAEPDYALIRLEIAISRPAQEVWSKVGGYCQIDKWLPLDCRLTSGDGNIGSIRVLAGGRVTEIMIAQTALSYGYTQPVQQGQFYNMYHGFMEAVPVDAGNSRILYTLFLDVSDKADKAAKDADLARRRTTFENALKKMKEIAEAK